MRRPFVVAERGEFGPEWKRRAKREIAPNDGDGDGDDSK